VDPGFRSRPRDEIEGARSSRHGHETPIIHPYDESLIPVRHTRLPAALAAINVSFTRKSKEAAEAGREPGGESREET